MKEYINLAFIIFCGLLTIYSWVKFYGTEGQEKATWLIAALVINIYMSIGMNQ